MSGSGSAESARGEPAGLGAIRLEALCDGVFAIAMTLLVLELKVPVLPDGASPVELRHSLLALWPRALCYLMSFINAGALWIAHRGQFHYIHRTDRPLLWINIVFLMFVSAIPFFTALLGQYPSYRVPVALYGCNMILAVIMLWFHWHYATTRRGLTGKHLADAVVRLQSRRILLGPLIYLVAILGMLWSTWLSIVLYALVPIGYALPGAVDRHWRHSEASKVP
jgi:uncharacterized membrane protein